MNKVIDQLRTYKNLEYLILSFILLFALISRLYKINNAVADWHSWRQADTASVTRTFLTQGVDLLFPRYHDISTTQTGYFNPKGLRFVEFPIFNAFHALLVQLFPVFSLEVWGRLTSVISMLVSTVVLFLLGKRFIGGWGGILTASFFAFLPFNIYFTRVILPEPMATTFALLSTWFFIMFIDQEKTWHLFLSASLFAAAMLIKPFTFFYLVPMAFLAVKKFGFSGILRNTKLLLAIDLALIPFFLWRIWMNQYPQGIPHWQWAFNGGRIRFRPAFWRWIFGERLGRLILGIWGLVPFSFGLLVLDSKVARYASKKYRQFTQYQAGAGFIYALILGMFAYVTVFAAANVRHDYYQTIVIPAISLILARGSLYLWENGEFGQLISRSLLLFSILMMIGISAYQVKEFYKINRPEIIQAGQAVDRLTPKDALVIAPYNGDTAFLYQTRRWGWPVVDRPIEELIEKGADYFVSVDIANSETQEIVSRFEVVEKTANYVIVDLKKPTKQ